VALIGGGLTLGVLGYCAYVFIAAAVIRYRAGGGVRGWGVKKWVSGARRPTRGGPFSFQRPRPPQARVTRSPMHAPTAADWEAQVDEVVALASIFGEERVAARGGEAAVAASALLGAGGDALRAEPPPETPLEVRVALEVELGAPVELRARGARAGAVASLPPLRARAALPAGYPSSGAGLELAFSADWLAPEAVAAVVAAAEDAVAAAAGGPALFDALTAARDAALEAAAPGGVLDLDLVAGDDDGSADGADAAVALALALRAADAQADDAAFASAVHACPVCLEDVPGTACVRAGAACAHAACRACAAALARSALADRAPRRLACPSCAGPLAPARLRGLLTDAELSSWADLDRERLLATLPGLVRCPHCGGPAPGDDGDGGASSSASHHAVCVSCSHSFCTLCFAGYHPGRICASDAGRLAVLRARLAGGCASAADTAELRRREDDAASRALIERTAKPCPGCATPISKTGGCNKVVCRACGGPFCFTCGGTVDATDPYGHYRSGACILFDEADVAAFNAAVAAEGAAALADDRVPGPRLPPPPPAGRGHWLAFAPHAARCPVCASLVARAGNSNDARCGACATRHCAACGEILRGRGAGATHFGPRPPRCPQHGAR